MDVNNPKLHICSGNKFVDYEITIEVGILFFGDTKIKKNIAFLSSREEDIEFQTNTFHSLIKRFFLFRLPIKLSSENVLVSGEDIQIFVGSEQSYPVLR